MTEIPEISEDFRKVSEILIDLADTVEDLAGMVEVLGERLQCLIDNGIVSELPRELVRLLAAAGYPSLLDASSR